MTGSHYRNRNASFIFHPTRLVPNDGKPQQLIADLTLSNDPLELGEQCYLRVNEHMKYDRSRSARAWRGEDRWLSLLGVVLRPQLWLGTG